MDELKISNEIKGYIAMSGETVASVAEKVGLSRSAMTTKINNESLRYKDVKEIARLLGYEIIWKRIT